MMEIFIGDCSMESFEAARSRVKEELEQTSYSTLKRSPVIMKVYPSRSGDKVKTSKAIRGYSHDRGSWRRDGLQPSSRGGSCRRNLK